ncbi:FAD-binding oxidoreductase, partial [uncultured Chloroflexus sp.]|uniref:FAD-binding oxidoreductase n=1 Tax=uncultured Chloroflexus sp. TaxID=214040 RepID=UPI0026111AED
VVQYAIQGMLPQCVVSPATTAELAAVMKACHQAGVHVVPWGGGTQQAIGPLLDRPEVIIVTRRLNQVLRYDPDDLTIGVEAGMSLAELKVVLATHHQHFPVAVADQEHTTLGGLVATATNGPRCWGYGSWRDLVLGLTVVQGDGTVIRLGGQVVKNVSGYDLVKLFTGSYGTLGVITEVRLRTFPCPPATITLAAGFLDLQDVSYFLAALAATRLRPVAVEVCDAAAQDRQQFAGTLVVLAQFDGHPAACERSAVESASLATAHRARTLWLARGSEQDQLWQPVLRVATIPSEPTIWPIRVAVDPDQFAAVFADLRQSAAQHGVTATIAGRPYQGLVYGHLQGNIDQVGRMLTDLVTRWPHTQLPAGPLPLSHEQWRWGRSTTLFNEELSAWLKDAFDPAHRLNRRRWPFGMRAVNPYSE